MITGVILWWEFQRLGRSGSREDSRAFRVDTFLGIMQPKGVTFIGIQWKLSARSHLRVNCAECDYIEWGTHYWGAG